MLIEYTINKIKPANVKRYMEMRTYLDSLYSLTTLRAQIPKMTPAIMRPPW
jgi:hypothetical protein